jgi:hypothetical protein
VGGGHNSAALAINASGHSVGFSKTKSGGYDAVRWSPSGAATVLHDVGGQDDSEAVAENNHGQSIGFSLTKKGEDAVLWSPSGRATPLKDPGGMGFEYANAINTFGQSVGYAETPTGDEAVLWQPSGKATNLGAILGKGWRNTQAVGINDRGDIIGYGEHRGRIAGFLLTRDAPAAVSAAAFPAVPLSATSAPEPSTWAMLVVGFAGLGLAGCRRSRKHFIGVSWMFASLFR